jgi:ADP-ribose diphosphatase
VKEQRTKPLDEKRRKLSRAIVRVHETKEIYRGKSYSFVTEEVTLPNGLKTKAAMVRHPGSTAIVPLFEDGSVALTRQYRHPVRDYLLEIPAGTMEPGESPIDCAKRELQEETGLVAEDFRELAGIHILPSYSDEMIHIFLAKKLTTGPQRLDQDEIIEVVRHPLAELMEMIDTGQITCALTMIAIHRAVRYLEANG